MAVILTSEIMGKVSQLMNTDRATGTMPEHDLKCLVSRNLERRRSMWSKIARCAHKRP